jgi:hypothetical protein
MRENENPGRASPMWTRPGFSLLCDPVQQPDDLVQMSRRDRLPGWQGGRGLLAERLVGSAAVVVHAVQSDDVGQILDLL